MILRRILWAVLALAAPAAVILAERSDNPGWRRVVLFAFWGMAALVVFSWFVISCAIAMDKFPDEQRKRRTVPAWLNFLADMACCCVLVYYGWAWTCAAWAVQQIACQFSMELIAPKKETEAK